MDSSFVLYEHRKYAQSIFLFQQSIEKATKSVGLLLGLAKPTRGDLMREVGHASVLAVLVRLPERVQNLRSDLDVMAKSPSTRKAKQELDSLGLGSLMPDPQELSRKLIDEKTAGQQASLVRKPRANKMWRITLELDSTNPMVAAILNMLDNAEADWKSLDKFTSQFEKIAPSLRDPEMVRYFLNVRGRAFPEVVPLAFVSMWHERETRYPPIERTDYWNPNEYNATKGLVKLYPRLYRHAERLCAGVIAGARAALKI